MSFHFPSFLLGVVAGATGASLWDRLRPIAVELSSAGVELGESLWGRIAALQEDTEDALAVARARPAAVAPRTVRRARRGASRR